MNPTKEGSMVVLKPILKIGITLYSTSKGVLIGIAVHKFVIAMLTFLC